MSLDNLSAEDLAQIDSVCLHYEAKIREGQDPSIEKMVAAYSGEYVELLRNELLAIQSELSDAIHPRSIREPFLADSPDDIEESVGSVTSEGEPDSDLDDSSPIQSPVSASVDESSPSVDESPPSVDESMERCDSDDSREDSSRSTQVQASDEVQTLFASESVLAEVEAQLDESAYVQDPEVESVLADNRIVEEPPVEEPPEDRSSPASGSSGDVPPAGQKSDVTAAPDMPVTSAPEVPVTSVAARYDQENVDELLPREGQMIGPYRVRETLGRGGMGIVFAATDTRLDRQVAIKMLAVGGKKRAELTERFEREARAVAALSHPNIVELFDVGVVKGLPFAVMEFLDGETLTERMQRRGLSIIETRRLGAQIADALAVAHQGGVIHRDLKPQNVMLVRRNGGGDAEWPHSSDPITTSSTTVKLVDFGLSRVPIDSKAGDSSLETTEGMILGTPGYMAPEQARGEPISELVDIFSLGCILHEAFYGTPAIIGDTAADRFASTLEGSPAVDPIRRRADTELADVISECLEKRPEHRPQSAEDLALRLRPSLSAAGHAVGQVGSSDSAAEVLRRHFVLAAAGGIVGAVLGGLIAPSYAQELKDIQSLAVLSFVDGYDPPTTAGDKEFGMPLADKKLGQGDRIAALLVNELSGMNRVAVMPFRPMVARNPSEFTALNEMLGVDAFIAGTVQPRVLGEETFTDLNLAIVSARTGTQLWGKTFVYEASDSLIQQSKIAGQVAEAIDDRLAERDPRAEHNVESFGCLVDGKVRADPDSVTGLKEALMCLNKAKSIDGSYAEPRAGIALASITLAAQSDPESAKKLIGDARAELDFLTRRQGGKLTSIDARLAAAMLDWQTLGRYREAKEELDALALVRPYNWQVRHQLGLLLLTYDQVQVALQTLKEAKKLFPMSAIIKVDLARGEWFSGRAVRAKTDAKWILDQSSCPFARGLLIDIYEHERDYGSAAAVDSNFGLTGPVTSDAYFAQRRKCLVDQPYGPFGKLMNEAIFELRLNNGRMEDIQLAKLGDSQSPMFPLLLARHPEFGAVRLMQRAREILPAPLRFESL